jgi:hypothetical protein
METLWDFRKMITKPNNVRKKRFSYTYNVICAVEILDPGGDCVYSPEK